MIHGIHMTKRIGSKLLHSECRRDHVRVRVMCERTSLARDKVRVVKVYLHTTPFDTEGPDALLLTSIVRLLATDQVALLHAGSETSSADDVEEIKLLFPTHAAAEEVAMEAERIAGVGCVLASEAKAGRHEVRFLVQVPEKRVRRGNVRQRKLFLRRRRDRVERRRGRRRRDSKRSRLCRGRH